MSNIPQMEGLDEILVSPLPYGIVVERIGIIAGCFDVIHPGYIKMFKEAKENCEWLIVLLHNDPSIERQNKIKPVLSVEERMEILEAIRYVDEVIPYNTEKELAEILLRTKHHVRFLGSDYIGKSYVGDKSIPVHYIKRDHGWSSTKFKKMIIKQGVPL